MKRLISMVMVTILMASQVAFASDLEIVEEANQAPQSQNITPEAQASSVEPVSASDALITTAQVLPENQETVADLKTDISTDNVLVSNQPANESLIMKAQDEAGIVAQPKKKVMPLPPAVPCIGVSEPTRYTLGADDVVEVIVRRHGEFSGTYPVNAEGKIQYKFVGDIEVKGLTKTELKERITGILSKFIINPDVEVTIIEYRSKVIYVIGEVGSPGKYYMKADKISLREAVVQAGLPTLSASMRRTQLIRPDKSGKPKEIKVDLYALLYEGKLNLDQEMIPGDVLIVPATFFAKVMRIVSPIAAPIASSDTIRRVGTGGF